MAIQEKFPSIRPSLNLDFANTKTLDPRITFSRASTATYYDGKTVAKAEENLLLRSQEFDDAYWSKSQATVTANGGVAPDGTTTADLCIDNTVDTRHGLSRSISGLSNNTLFTLSVFLKANTLQYAMLRILTDNATKAYGALFDLSNGTFLSSTLSGGANQNSYAITSVGNGWYRVSVTAFNTSGTVTSSVRLSDSSTPSFVFDEPSYAGTGNSIYIWGAQLEQRSQATAYTPTTTQPITNYVPVLRTAAANVARFDHNPVTGESLGLLIEEQRTNLLTYSEQFDHASWLSVTNVTVQPNVAISPDGTLTADKLVSSAVSGNHFLYKTTPSLSSGVSYTLTFFAKKAEYSYVTVQLNSGAYISTRTIRVDLDTGLITTTNGTVVSNISSAGNGWWKISLSATTDASGTTFAYIAGMPVSGTYTYTGDGYSGIYIWGAQLEAGATASSYIKTEASQVTRSADNASMAGANFSSWYRQDEGALLVTYSRTASGNATEVDTLVSVDNGANNNRIQIRFYNAAVDAVVLANSSIMFDAPGASIPGIETRSTAAAYKENDFVFVHAGAAAQIDTSGVVPLVNRLGVGNGAFGEYANAYIRKIAYYPKRLTNTQLQALTS